MHKSQLFQPAREIKTPSDKKPKTDQPTEKQNAFIAGLNAKLGGPK